MKTKTVCRSLAGAVAILLGIQVLNFYPLFAADEPTMKDRVKEVVQDSKETAQTAGRSAAADLEDLWKRVDASRLKNRTPDEIVAWVIMGVLVGAVAGMMTSLKSTGLGRVGKLLLGLAGAFIGGIVVHVGQINFGWGLVLIRYEELVFSLGGAVLLVLVGRIIRSKSRREVNK